MKNIFAILTTAVLWIAFVAASLAGEWQATPKVSSPAESSPGIPVAIFPPLETDSPAHFSSFHHPVPSLPKAMIPLTVDQLKLPLIDISPEGETSDTGTLPKPKIEFNAGLQSEHFDSGNHVNLAPNMIDGETDWNVSTVILFFGLDLNVGPGYFQSNAYMGQSSNNINCATAFLNRQALGLDTRGFNALAGYKLNKNITLEAGCGYLEQADKQTGASDEVWAIYAHAILSLAPGFQVVPGIGQIDFNNDQSTEEVDDNFFAGAKWEINF